MTVIKKNYVGSERKHDFEVFFSLDWYTTMRAMILRTFNWVNHYAPELDQHVVPLLPNYCLPLYLQHQHFIIESFICMCCRHNILVFVFVYYLYICHKWGQKIKERKNINNHSLCQEKDKWNCWEICSTSFLNMVTYLLVQKYLSAVSKRI